MVPGTVFLLFFSPLAGENGGCIYYLIVTIIFCKLHNGKALYLSGLPLCSQQLVLSSSEWGGCQGSWDGLCGFACNTHRLPAGVSRRTCLGKS